MRLSEIIENYLIEHPEVSLSELARRAHVSKSYLSMIKNGKDPRGNEIHPTAARLNLIAKAIGHDLDWMIANLDNDYKVVVSPSPTTKKRGYATDNDLLGEDVGMLAMNVPTPNDIAAALQLYQDYLMLLPDFRKRVDTLLKEGRREQLPPDHQ